MDITIHRTIELSGTTTLLLLIAAAIVFAVLYPMIIPAPKQTPEPPKSKLGFV
jgi:hypothetical protein